MPEDIELLRRCLKCWDWKPTVKFGLDPSVRDGYSVTCLQCEKAANTADPVDHPPHYGGKDDPYEAIKVVEAWGLGFCLGNVVKYICRAEQKGSPIENLRKARWYLDREIARREREIGWKSNATTE